MGEQKRRRAKGATVILTDRPEIPPEENNYQVAVNWLRGCGRLDELEEVGAHVLGVKHDDWCGVFDGRACDCEPVLEVAGVRKEYPKSLLKGRVRRYGQP